MFRDAEYSAWAVIMLAMMLMFVKPGRMMTVSFSLVMSLLLRLVGTMR